MTSVYRFTRAGKYTRTERLFESLEALLDHWFDIEPHEDKAYMWERLQCHEGEGEYKPTAMNMLARKPLTANQQSWRHTALTDIGMEYVRQARRFQEEFDRPWSHHQNLVDRMCDAHNATLVYCNDEYCVVLLHGISSLVVKLTMTHNGCDFTDMTPEQWKDLRASQR